jgi:hypothetical protein
LGTSSEKIGLISSPQSSLALVFLFRLRVGGDFGSRGVLFSVVSQSVFELQDDCNAASGFSRSGSELDPDHFWMRSLKYGSIALLRVNSIFSFGVCVRFLEASVRQAVF